MQNKSARRAAKILKYLGEAGAPLGLSQIARGLQFHPSTVHRILSSLTAEGLVEQDSRTQKYGLSVELFALGRAAVRHLGINERIQSELRSLALTVGETVNFGVIRQERVIYIFSAESKETLRAGIKIGSTHPAHTTAIGKIILAWTPPEGVDAYLEQTSLEKIAPNSITSSTQLRKRLDKIREDGHTVDIEECSVGVNAIGAPIYSAAGDVIAGLAVTGPAARMQEKKIKSFTRAVIITAGSISRLLGYLDEDLLDLELLTESLSI